jgi:predicted MFS family arabinose efflux permease
MKRFNEDGVTQKRMGRDLNLYGIRRKLSRLLFALSAVAYMQRLSVSAAATPIVHDFALTSTTLGYVFSSFALAYALFEIPFGRLGDRFGPARVLAWLVGLWSLAALLTTATVTVTSLILARFLVGAGQAGTFPNITRLVSNCYPRGERGRSLGMAFVGVAVGAGCTTPLVQTLLRYQHWRLTLIELSFPAFAWVWWWRSFMRELPAAYDGAMVDQLAAGNLDSIEPLAVEGLSLRNLLRNSNILAICGMYFTFGYGIYFYITWLPIYLLKGRGFEPTHVSLFASLPWLMGAVGYSLGGRVTDELLKRDVGIRVARGWVGASGLAGSGACLLIVAFIANRNIAVLALGFAACFQFATAAAAWAVCIDVGRQHSGVVSGLMNTVGNLGGALAPLVVGYSLRLWGSWKIPFIVTAALFACGIAMWIAIDPSRPVVGNQSVLCSAD